MPPVDESISMSNALLSTYLNDHLAGSTVGVELARRAARNNRGTEYGAVLAELASEITDDRRALQALMDSLGVGSDRIKLVVAWSAEKVGRLKPNGRLTGYSPLSRLEELELLSIGVEGKLLLWQALSRIEGLPDVDLQVLIERARSQRQRLERQRLKAAPEALGAPQR